MIDKGEYTKEELLSLLDCKDLSNAKRKLDRLGYSYATNNKKGNNYKLIITSVPVTAAAAETFRKICVDELGVSKNIDFEKLAILVCFLEYDTNFVNLTLEQQEKRIKEKGFILTRQTIEKHLEVFANNGILVYGVNEYSYYVPLKTTKFITREEWLSYWDNYFNGTNESLQLVENRIGGKPIKRLSRIFGNALIPAYKPLVESAKNINEKLVEDLTNKKQA